jgi:uncharacterized protein (DUF362 family)
MSQKAFFHERWDMSIKDPNHYSSPDFTVMDATVGLKDFHLGSARCEPSINRIIAGWDACAVGREAAGLLGLDWRHIGHLI